MAGAAVASVLVFAAVLPAAPRSGPGELRVGPLPSSPSDGSGATATTGAPTTSTSPTARSGSAVTSLPAATSGPSPTRPPLPRIPATTTLAGVTAAAGGGGDPGPTPASGPGAIYLGNAEVRSTGDPVDAVPSISFLNGSGQVIDTVRGQEGLASSSGWAPLAEVVAIGPPGTVSARLAVQAVTASQAGLLEVQGTSLGGFAPRPAAPVVGPVSTVGNRIVDGEGRTLVLRGIDLYQLESNPSPPGLDRDEIVALRAWGANLVRVSLGEQLLAPSACKYSPGYAAKVAQVVDWITSLGMVALLDLHLTAPVLCNVGQQQMADDPGSVQFWQELAGQYRGNPLVAFDLFNEPHDISDAVWLNGGQANSYMNFTAAGMQELYDTVRGAGAENLVVVTGDGWGSNLPAHLVQGTGIVYSGHVYTCPSDPPPKCVTPNYYDAGQYLGGWMARSSQVPMMIGEFGWPSQDDGTYAWNTIRLAGSQGWSWSVFAWEDGTTTSPFGVVAQLLPGPVFEPTPSGMPVLATLEGVG